MSVRFRIVHKLRSRCFCLNNNSKNNNDYLKLLQFTSESVVIVSTSSKGIGLEISKQILEYTQANIVALYRSPLKDDSPLTLLQNKYYDRLKVFQIDLENDDSIINTVGLISKQYKHIDALFNVAGILGGKMSPERSILDINKSWLLKTFEINLIGHILFTKAIWPLLTSSNKTQTKRIINISARVGSISDNRLGGWYSYRISKAGLNMFTKTLSIEGKRNNIIVLALHPGTTNTELSKPFQSNISKDKLFTTEYSVSKMLSVIENRTLLDSGKFYAYDGSEIPF